MIIKNSKHEITAVKQGQYPTNNLPEVTFVGRSNVGKSSIINSLLNRRNLARVGGTPGKTRVINFFNVDDLLYFVDLPGYGYAKASKEDQKAWGQFVETYFRNSKNIKLIISLIDIRHKPTNDDIMMHEWIKKEGLPCIVIATKSDKISRSQIKPSLNEIRKVLDLGEDTVVVPFSATKNQGKEEVLDQIEKIALKDTAES